MRPSRNVTTIGRSAPKIVLSIAVLLFTLRVLQSGACPWPAVSNCIIRPNCFSVSTVPLQNGTLPNSCVHQSHNSNQFGWVADGRIILCILFPEVADIVCLLPHLKFKAGALGPD